MLRYREWASRLPLEDMLASGTPSAWAGTSAVAAAIIAAVTMVPPLERFFELAWLGPVLVYPLAPLVDLSAGALHRKGIDRMVVVALSMVSATLLQAFCGLLIAKSSIHGAPIFSGLLLFTAAYHGFTYRASLRSPYMAIGTAVALVAMVLANPAAPRLPVIAVLAPASIGAALLVGTFASRADLARTTAQSIRAALTARMLEDQSTRAEQLGAVVEHLAMWNHDMRNSLTVAMGNMALLGRLARVESAAPIREELLARVDELRKSLGMLTSGLEDIRKLARSSTAAPRAELISVAPMLPQLSSTIHTRFPHVRLALPELSARTGVSVRGGAVSLYRLLENLLINACEGDGTRGAARVALGVSEDAGFASIEIVDDGPGFSLQQLARPIVGFETTKAEGTGLGLYTVERLVAASGGTLARANRPEGGARVTVRLPSERSS